MYNFIVSGLKLKEKEEIEEEEAKENPTRDGLIDDSMHVSSNTVLLYKQALKILHYIYLLCLLCSSVYINILKICIKKIKN